MKVHRDIKPGNILIDESGSPRLSDFDISVETEHRTTVQYTQRMNTHNYNVNATSNKNLLRQCSQGTKDYMAPELSHGPATYKSDMYAFGVTLEEVTTPHYNDDSHLIKLISLLQSNNSNKRPTAEEATKHQYFEDAFQWKRDERRTCCICFDEYYLSEGAECTNKDIETGLHFACTDCISRHVNQESTADLRDIVKRGARVFCPMKVEGCTSEAYPDILLAKQLRDKPISLQNYFSARKRLLESQASEEADNRVKIELDRLISMDENERIIYQKRRYIIENILNCSCPRCHQVFLDFSDCFALKCSRCPCGFCAWCLLDCGDDAHEHVKNCPYKTNSDDFFGSVDEFEGAQRKRRIRELKKFLNEIDADIRTDVLAAIKTDLIGLDDELGKIFYGDDEGGSNKKVKFFAPNCNQGHEMIVTATLEGGYRGGFVCDKCRTSVGPFDGQKKLTRWCCIQCTADYCFNCDPKPPTILPKRSDSGEDKAIELKKEDVEEAIKEEKLVLIVSQDDIEIGTDVVWKRGREKNHRKDGGSGTKDNGEFGTYLATKITRKKVNGWGTDTACDLPECNFVCIQNKNDWENRTGTVYRYVD